MKRSKIIFCLASFYTLCLAPISPALAIPPAAAQMQYRIVDLGPLPGFPAKTPVGLSGKSSQITNRFLELSQNRFIIKSTCNDRMFEGSAGLMYKIVLLMLFLFLPASSAEARPAQAQPSYALQQKNADGDSVILRVYDRNTDRTVWRRRCIGACASSWSVNHRSVAIVISHLDGHPTVGQFRLLYWRAGEAVRLVGHPQLFQDFDEVGDDMYSGPRMGGDSHFGVVD